MQVILQEDYPSLGFVGDVVKVKEGFARNYLIPQKIAIPSSSANIKFIEHRKKQLDIKKQQKKQDAEKYKAKVEEVKINIKHAAGEGDRLFGSVTSTEIQQELENAGITVDRKLIRLEAPIKTVGTHSVEIKLHQEVSAKVQIIVEAKEEKKATKAKPAEKVEKKASQEEPAAEIKDESKDEASSEAEPEASEDNKDQ